MIISKSHMIRRVVSCFLLFEENKVAVFHRQATMPTFPGHWAAISGSLENSETPLEAAQRELEEETNLKEVLSTINQSISMLPFGRGLYVDVPYTGRQKQDDAKHSQQPLFDTSDSGNQPIAQRDLFQPGNIIRVYPFVFEVPLQVYKSLELRDNEHDEMKWITLDGLETLSPTVPALTTAFHHATCGKYVKEMPVNVKEWANDRVNGAATLAKQVLRIVRDGGSPTNMKMLRPSMVAITNVLQKLESDQERPALLHEIIQTSLEREANRAVELAVIRISEKIQDHKGPSFVIGVFSRSSTLLSILKRIEESHSHVQFVCSQSTPGDEGILMAKDLGRATCVTDTEMLQRVKNGDIHLVLVGCDCVMDKSVVNKIGTSDLAKAADGSCPIFCCSDRWKIWEDEFPPPLEFIFEQIPRSYFDEILLPPPL